mgnify:FL=1
MFLKFYSCEKILVKLPNLSSIAINPQGDYKEARGIKILTDFIECNITLKFELFKSFKKVRGCEAKYVETTKCDFLKKHNQY